MSGRWRPFSVAEREAVVSAVRSDDVLSRRLAIELVELLGDPWAVGTPPGPDAVLAGELAAQLRAQCRAAIGPAADPGVEVVDVLEEQEEHGAGGQSRVRVVKVYLYRLGGSCESVWVVSHDCELRQGTEVSAFWMDCSSWSEAMAVAVAHAVWCGRPRPVEASWPSHGVPEVGVAL